MGANRIFKKNTKPCKIFQKIQHFQDIHNFSAHQAVSLECCSSCVDSVVLWSKVFCARLTNHPALWESNTRVKNPNLEDRSDAVVGIVLWWVWFCMSLNIPPALWKSKRLVKKVEKKWKKHDFLKKIENRC